MYSREGLGLWCYLNDVSSFDSYYFSNITIGQATTTKNKNWFSFHYGFIHHSLYILHFYPAIQPPMYII